MNHSAPRRYHGPVLTTARTSLAAFAVTWLVAGMFKCWVDGYPRLEDTLEQLAPTLTGPTVSVALAVAGLVALVVLARRVEPARSLASSGCAEVRA